MSDNGASVHPSWLDALPPANYFARVAAVEMRAATIAERFPDAFVHGGATGELDDPPYVVCWRPKHGIVWLWRVMHFGDPDGRQDAREWAVPHVCRAIGADPLSNGLKIVPGPPFVDLGLPARQGHQLVMGPMWVDVYDSGRPGDQWYRTHYQWGEGRGLDRDAQVHEELTRVMAKVAREDAVERERLRRGAQQRW